jgi:hypothetical protein
MSSSEAKRLGSTLCALSDEFIAEGGKVTVLPPVDPDQPPRKLTFNRFRKGRTPNQADRPPPRTYT